MKNCVWMIAATVLAAGCGQPTSNWRDWFTNSKQTPEEERALAAKRAEEAKPEPPPTILPTTYIAAGRMLESNGDIAGAIAQYQRAIAANPREITAYSRLGIAYQRIGQFQEAEKTIQKGLAIDPDAAHLHNNLGYGFMMQQKYDLAIGAFQKALAIKPDFKRARMNLAMTFGRIGRMDESLSEFQRVVPADSAHYNVAVLCMQQSRNADAKRHFSQALAINPTCPGAREGLERLQQLAVPVTAQSPTPATYTLTPDGLHQSVATSNQDVGTTP